MKHFLKKTLLYIIVVFLIIVIVEVFNFYTQEHKMNGMGSEIYYAIDKSKTKKRAKKLVLGDSVGNQLYPCPKDYDSVVSLACNQAITMAGQYFLLKNYFEANAETLPEEVILLMTPFCLCNNVDQYAYHHFLKPFPRYEYSDLYTDYLTQRIHSIPLYWSANLPIIRSSAYTPQWAVPSSPYFTPSVSPLSYEYLLKMDSISMSHNVSFRIISPPLRNDRRDDVDTFWAELPSEYVPELSGILQPFKESITFLPSRLYVDGVHFSKENVPADYLKLLGNCHDL